MISLAFAIVILAAADPAPATASPATQSAATASQAKSADKPGAGELVCKREAVLGSRMKQRMCLTQADWDARKADARADIEKAQTNQRIK